MLPLLSQSEGWSIGRTVIVPSLYFTFSDSLILAHYGEGIGQPQTSALLYFNEQGEVKDSLPEFANPGDPMGMDQISSINVFKQLPGNANIGGLIYINYQDGWYGGE